MRRLFKFLVPIGLLAVSGCVVAPYPYGYYRHGYYGPGFYGPGYYGPRVAVVAPAPVMVIRP
jgi:hypothetical protein